MKFIADATSFSVHMALKAVWWCEASTKYVNPELVKNAIQLTEMIETSLVNAPVVLTDRDRLIALKMRDYAGKPARADSASARTQGSERQQETATLLQELARCRPRPDSEHLNSVTPFNKPRGSHFPVPSAALPCVEDLKLQHKRQCIKRALADIGYMVPGNEESTLSRITPLVKDSDLSLGEGSAEYEELISFICKQVRSEYFNAHIALVRFFNSLSARLTRKPRGRERNIALAHYLAQCSPFGLYFPIYGLLDPHFRIVRIFHDEGIVLNSRDKAPFLLWAEITRSQDTLTLDPNIFRAYDPVSARTVGKSLAPPLSFYFEPTVDAPTRGSQKPNEINTKVEPDSGEVSSPTPSTPYSFDNESTASLTPAGSVHVNTTANLSADHPQRSSSPEPSMSTQSQVPAVVPQQFSMAQEQPRRSPSPESQAPAVTAALQPSVSPSQRDPFGEPAAEKSLRLLKKVYGRAHHPPSLAHMRRGSLLLTNLGSVSDEIAAAIKQGEADAESKEVVSEKDQETQVTRARAASRALEDADRQAALHWQEDQTDDAAFLSSIPAGTDLLSVIFKGGDDCRQEVLAMQLIQIFDQIWTEADLPLKLRPYAVLVTSANSGLIETVTGTTSIDSLKKNTPNFISLAHFFTTYFGPRNTDGRFEEAQMNFVQSMAAYSLVSYFLQIKDRHNGNILLDNQGHIVHIDFGFMLSSSPGGNLNFESAPFKLTPELIEVMDGESSDLFQLFTSLFIRGFIEARRHAHRILTLVELMESANMTAFLAGGKSTVEMLRLRFQLDLPDDACMEYAMSLVEESTNNWRSNQYDTYQKITNGIL